MAGIDPLSAGAAALGLVGSGVSAYGTIIGADQGADALQRGKYANFLASQYKAKQLNNAATQAMAAGQQQAIGAAIDKNLSESKAQAINAAGGGGATDSSYINTLAGIEKQGEYNKAMSLFEGETRMRDLNYQAQNALIEGQNDLNATDYQSGQLRRNALLAATGTILGGAASAADRYGRGRNG